MPEKTGNGAERQKLFKKFTDYSFSLKACIAEFFAMTLFVYLGCGSAVFFSANSAVNNSSVWEAATGANRLDDVAGAAFLKYSQTASSWGIVVALTFGLGIAVLAYCTAHVSGGQINPVVSFMLFVAGRMGPVQMVGNIIAQYIGSILGASLLYGTVPNAANSSLGANAVSPTFTHGQAVCGEAVMTCILVFTVLQTACEPRSIAKNMAPLAIGLSVFLGHCVLLPIDGCSINPARTFGPALISNSFGDGYWVFYVGPWVGGLFGVMCHVLLWLDWDAKIAVKGKKTATNDVSNDNSGLNDNALRIR